DRRLLAAILKSLKVDDGKTPDVFAVIDKLDRQPRELSIERLRNAGVDSAAADRLVSLKDLDSVDAIQKAFPDKAVGDCLGAFAQFLRDAEALGVREWIQVDLTIVRGLAYYTGMVFELFDAQGEFRAICGGGRYDTLLASLGGADAPALGFGMGDVVLGELLKARGKMPALAPTLDVWVAFDETQRERAMRVATSLRRSGKAVEYALRPAQLGKQLEAASKAGAARAVILKADGSAVERDLATKTETPFTFVDG
ncbi:MAG TPA: ATP phosphoribosyltransferase regulatory subunit, partial [Gemmatimonadaceae bacterium]